MHPPRSRGRCQALCPSPCCPLNLTCIGLAVTMNLGLVCVCGGLEQSVQVMPLFGVQL